jgi:hypothetical protein
MLLPLARGSPYLKRPFDLAAMPCLFCFWLPQFTILVLHSGRNLNCPQLKKFFNYFALIPPPGGQAVKVQRCSNSKIQLLGINLKAQSFAGS